VFGDRIYYLRDFLFCDQKKMDKRREIVKWSGEELFGLLACFSLRFQSKNYTVRHFMRILRRLFAYIE
jgi:hypothetical protein